MTAVLSFWAGLAAGWLSAIAAGAALWYGMLRYLRGMDPADLRPRCNIGGGTSTPDVAFIDELGEITTDQWYQLATRGPVTDYAPGVAHHELTPDTDQDGTTIYRSTR